MTVNLMRVLSEQQKEIYLLHVQEGNSIPQVAEKLGCSQQQIKIQIKRLNSKINELQKMDIDITDITNTFNDDTVLPHLTLTQAQFLANHQSMKCQQKSKSAIKKMNSRLGLKENLSVRKMTADELAKTKTTLPKVNPLQDVMANPRLAGYEIEYQSHFGESNISIEYMASLEIILRAHSIIYQTPYINKINRKTSIALRAREEGYTSTLVRPDENRFIPQGAKHLETIRDDNGKPEYSVYLFPGTPKKRNKNVSVS